MRISDWSSDVCSSDLLTRQLAGTRRAWHSAAPGSTREPDILRRGRYRRLIGPDTARVVDLLGRALIQRDRFEDFVIDEHDHQRAAFDRVVDTDQPRGGAGQGGGQDLGLGLHYVHAIAAAAGVG